MPSQLKAGMAGEDERRLARMVINGLLSVHDNLTAAMGLTRPAQEQIKAAQDAVQASIGIVSALSKRLEIGDRTFAIKFVSDELHRALKELSKADGFRDVSTTVLYSMGPIGRDLPRLVLPSAAANLADAVGALRQFVRSQLELEPIKVQPAIEGVPSPIDYVWADERMIVSPSSANIPLFPFPSAERDHAQRLEACLVQAKVREDYAVELSRYVRRLPTAPGSGNILLADSAARNLRGFFAAEQQFLPAPFASRMRTVLQHHIALRPFYPELNAFYAAVRSGRIDEPLPIDAIDEFVEAVRAQTPSVFDPSVVGAINETGSSVREPPASDEPLAKDVIAPPEDPLGELDPKASHDFQLAGAVNRFWKVFSAGDAVSKASAGWLAAYAALAPNVSQVLRWLQRFLGH